jgi:adenylylsulfate kinase
MKKILIMGLPAAGKTYLANELKQYLSNHNVTVDWFNADEVRKQFNDWDFTHEGRLRQATRMRDLAAQSNADFVICDFVAPLEEMRESFSADWTIWINTITEGRFEDTNKAFVKPSHYDFEVTTQCAQHWVPIIATQILSRM